MGEKKEVEDAGTPLLHSTEYVFCVVSQHKLFSLCFGVKFSDSGLHYYITLNISFAWFHSTIFSYSVLVLSPVSVDSTITLSAYFAWFHSISFSSSVLVLNPATTQKPTIKYQSKTQCPEWEESEVYAHQSIWKCC